VDGFATLFSGLAGALWAVIAMLESYVRNQVAERYH